MPYKSVADLPKAQTDQYSHAAKERFRATFNAVHASCGDENRAFAAAHAAAHKHSGEEHKSKLRRSMGYDGRAK